MKKKSSPEKLYTYSVLCTFELQYSFKESEVENDPNGDENDYSPTDAAIEALEKNLLETLQNEYVVDSVNAHSEFYNLIGID